jgi:MFS family permease
MVTLAGEWFPDRRGTATGIVIGVGCLGGFIVPSLTGVIAELSSVTIAVGSFAFWGVCIAVAAYAAEATRAPAR